MRNIRTLIGGLLTTFALSGCGSTQVLSLPEGAKPVPTAYGAAGPANVYQLMSPPVQSVPGGGSEPLMASIVRVPDGFDLPPEK